MNGAKERLMRNIQETAFTALECALYLDGHPNNRRALAKHAEATKRLKEYTERYESLYGPLTHGSAVTQNGAQSGWSWIDGAWPWQNGEEV